MVAVMSKVWFEGYEPAQVVRNIFVCAGVVGARNMQALAEVNLKILMHSRLLTENARNQIFILWGSC